MSVWLLAIALQLSGDWISARVISANRLPSIGKYPTFRGSAMGVIGLVPQPLQQSPIVRKKEYIGCREIKCGGDLKGSDLGPLKCVSGVI